METISTPHTLNYTVLKHHIINWLGDYADKSGAKGFVLGVSGGIDSAVVSTLCAMTGKKVLILNMPIHQEEGQLTRAENHIEWLEINYPNVTSKTIDLTDTYDTIAAEMAKEVAADGIEDEDFLFSLANTRSRLRMTALYQMAGVYKSLVAGTGNKVEDFGIGFYTKYGDGGVDLSPIADLMKSEVYALGKEIGVDGAILSAAPTDGLHTDGRTDEDQIGATYDELEWAMEFRAKGRDTDEAGITRKQLEVIDIYDKLHNNNRHKMNPIPICSIEHLR